MKSLKESCEAAHPEGEAEQFIANPMGFPGKNREAVLWPITRRLSEGVIWKEFHAQSWRRHILMIDENRESELKQLAHYKALHLTAIPLRSIAAGELHR